MIKVSGRQDWQAAFAEYRRANPSASFSEFYSEEIAQKVECGGLHYTLGGNLQKRNARKGEAIAFADAGAAAFQSLKERLCIAPRHRLIDFGCGSLRLGYHAMLYLEPGNYFGLDPTERFIAMGKTLANDAIVTRRPHLAAISAQNLEAARAFAADFVVSIEVAHHVHPRETRAYYDSLQLLTAKPGAVLLFDVKLSEKRKHYSRFSWSWPLDFYLGALPGLTFVRKHDENMLEFRRPDSAR